MMTKSRSTSRGRGKQPAKDVPMADVDGADAGGDGDDVETQMQAMMGFGGFGTTKQKKVQGNDAYAVAKSKSAQYRQYMNRPGGFNRALSPA